MAKDRKSRDQKRKAKLAKRSQKTPLTESLAYFGNKYKNDGLTLCWMEIEMAIYEVDVITEFTLLDRMVTSAVETLVRKLRVGTLPELDDSEELIFHQGTEVEFLYQNLCRHLDQNYCEGEDISKSELIGILRSTLGTIEQKRSPASDSRRYLQYIGSFLTKKLGVSVSKVDFINSSVCLPG